MVKNLVSVIITCHNYGSYLSDLLGSISAQTYTNIEVIAVNDFSTDDTWKILQKFKQNYSKRFRIILIQNTSNIGVSASFEKGIRLSRGEYIAVCDADDVWLKDKIEIQVKEIKKKNLGLVYSDMIIVDDKLQIISSSFMKTSLFYFINQKKDIFQELLYANHIPGPTILFKSIYKEKLIPFSKDAIQDEWIAWIISGNDFHIGYIPQTTVLYRQHGNNMIGAGNNSFRSLFFDPTLLVNHIKNKNRLLLSLQEINNKRVLPKYSPLISNLITRQKIMLEYFDKIQNKRCTLKDFLYNLIVAIRYFSFREISQILFFYLYYSKSKIFK